MALSRKLSLVLVTCMALAACASKPALAPTAVPNDPLEEVNRDSFAVHMFFDRILFLPMAEGYRFVVPTPVRNSIRNVLNNLNSPVILANDVLQGDFEAAETTVARFYVNTTFGIGGVFDLGSNVGLPRRNEDFGQTLAVWGVDEGPYLFIPMIGPAPPRDLIGYGVDFLFDPFTYVEMDGRIFFSIGRSGLDAIDLRERNIETQAELEQQSLDFYGSVRGLYRQQRNNDITNGDMPLEDLPNF